MRRLRPFEREREPAELPNAVVLELAVELVGARRVHEEPDGRTLEPEAQQQAALEDAVWDD